MANTVNFYKISGVTQVAMNSGYPKAYFNTVGKYTPLPDNSGVYITLGGDPYEVALSDLRINGVTPSTLLEALTLLNALFSA